MVIRYYFEYDHCANIVVKFLGHRHSTPKWPERFSPQQVSSCALSPFLLPLLVNPRRDLPYISDLKDRLLDLTVRMSKKYTNWYAEKLPHNIDSVNSESLSLLPFVTRRQLTEHREDFVAGITTFAFATFTGGTSDQPPLMIERAIEEQTYLSNLINGVTRQSSELQPLGLVAVNGSHGQVFQIPGNSYSFSINFEQDSSFRKAAWLLQQVFSFPGFEPTISFVQGYFEFIHLLALYLKENNISLSLGQIKRVACYGMAIPSRRRVEVSKIFGAPVSDNFSLGEVHGSAPYDPHDDTYAFSPFVHAEVVDLESGSPVDCGSGELVVTTLFPFTQRFPLIRYRTGDLVFTQERVPLGPLFRVRGRLHGSCQLGRGQVISLGDVALALEELPFVARWPGFTSAVMHAPCAAGPKFKLHAKEPLGAEVLIEISETDLKDLAASSQLWKIQVRTSLLEVLPIDTRKVLKKSPELLVVTFVEDLECLDR